LLAPINPDTTTQDDEADALSPVVDLEKTLLAEENRTGSGG
jgi:hypothetical protein